MADEVKSNAAPAPGGEQTKSETTPEQRPASTAPTGGGYQGGGRPGGGGFQRRGPGGPGGPRGERRPGQGGPRGDRKFFRRKKVCKFCVEKIDAIDYKDVGLLRQFVAERGKIVPRRLTGVCTPHQRRLTTAIKQARNIALLPFQAHF
jgi:small subunit ribosomal protein S18